MHQLKKTEMFNFRHFCHECTILELCELTRLTEINNFGHAQLLNVVGDAIYRSIATAHSIFFVLDEVDVIGYTSTQSDTDDHSSVQSASSDSGVAMSTSRLTLSEMDVL